MLKPSSPTSQTEAPADADGTGAAPSQGDTAINGPKGPRRYEVPEADALSELPNRPHANTVRGQIQRVRLDLLARENERLDHQLRELREQQNEYQEKDSAWREGWQNRLVDLSAQVDRLISEAEAAREVEPEQDDGPELRDTVKPLLLAVLEMLDDTDGQGRPVKPDTARVAASRAANLIASQEPEPSAASRPQPSQTAPLAAPAVAESDQAAVARPAAPVTQQAEGPAAIDEASELEPLADQALRQTGSALASIGRMESWDSVVPVPEVDPSDWPLPRPIEEADPAAAKAPGEPAPGPQVSNAAERPEISDRPISSPGNEAAGEDMAIEIARLLLPQDDAGDDDGLVLEPMAGIEEDVPQTAPESQDAPPEEADQSGETLELASEELPEIVLPEPVAAEDPMPMPARASGPEDRRPNPSQRDEGAASSVAASGLDQPAADSKPVPGEQPSAGEGAQVSGPGSLVKPRLPEPEPEPEVPTEPLPRCLTERWEDEGQESRSSSARGQPARRRDSGTYRWPFRRLRATIDHDHADPETEPRPIKRPRGNTRFGENLE